MHFNIYQTRIRYAGARSPVFDHLVLAGRTVNEVFADAKELFPNAEEIRVNRLPVDRVFVPLSELEF